MQQSAEVNVGGVWLSSLGPWGELKVEDRWPGGCWEVSCTLDPKLAHRHPSVAVRAPLLVTVGGVRWRGETTQADPETGEIIAQGLYRQGDSAPALNAAGMTTTVPDSAIDRAISSGWVDWKRPATLSAAAYSSSDAAGDATAQINSLGALLDEWAAGAGKRWGVDEQGVVYAAADPTATTHFVINTTVPVQAAQRAAATVIARWQDASGNYTTTERGNGRPVILVDLTQAGPLTATQAVARCDKILAATAGTATYGGFTLTREQIVGAPHLSTVRAGQRIALVDQATPDLSGLAPSLVLGGTVWDVAAGTVECTPVDAPDLDLGAILAAQGGVQAS